MLFRELISAVIYNRPLRDLVQAAPLERALRLAVITRNNLEETMPCEVRCM